MARVHPGARGPAFLDVKKTHTELRPSRQVNTMAHLIWEALRTSLDSRADITVDQRVRGVSIKGALAASIGRDTVFWTSAGEALVPAASRTLINATVPASL